MKSFIKITIFLFLSLSLSGCGKNNTEEYNESVQAGLDYLAAEEYTRAETQFEQALDLKKEDERVQSFLDQTIHFEKALNAAEEEDHNLALEEAEKVRDINNGSKGLVDKAEKFIKELEKDKE